MFLMKCQNYVELPTESELNAFSYTWNNDIDVTNWNDVNNYVTTNILAKSDTVEYWQTPEETYNLKTGDCEDFAILKMFLLKTKLNLDSEMIILKLENKESGIVSYHAIVYIIDDTEYLDINGFYSNTLEKIETASYTFEYNVSFYDSLTYQEVMYTTVNYHYDIF